MALSSAQPNPARPVTTDTARERAVCDAVPGALQVLFRDAAPYHLALDAAALVATEGALARVPPTVTGLTLVAREPVSDRFARVVFARPELARFAVLRLVGPWGNAGVAAFAGSSCTLNVTQLDFSEINLGAAGFRALLTANPLPALTELDLSFNPLGFDAAVALSLIDALPPNLEVLKLCDAQLHDGAAQFLANITALGNLKELWLTGNPLSAGAVSELRAALPETVDIVTDAAHSDELDVHIKDA